jgi:hypothetical protein
VISRDFSEVLLLPEFVGIKGDLFIDRCNGGFCHQEARGTGALGIGGFPFSAFSGCDFHDIVQGITLGPTCDAVSPYGEFSIIMNTVFYYALSMIFIFFIERFTKKVEHKNIT